MLGCQDADAFFVKVCRPIHLTGNAPFMVMIKAPTARSSTGVSPCGVRISVPRLKQFGLVPGAPLGNPPIALASLALKTVASIADETAIVDSLPAPAPTIAMK